MLVFFAVNRIEMEYAQEELIAIILLMASDRAAASRRRRTKAFEKARTLCYTLFE